MFRREGQNTKAKKTIRVDKIENTETREKVYKIYKTKPNLIVY